jgi:hypothetical protein
VTHGLRILVNILSGLAIGASLLVLAVASAFALSFINNAGVTLPGIIDIWTTPEPNGTTALNFLPNPAGMGVAVLVVATVYALAATLASRGRARRV